MWKSIKNKFRRNKNIEEEQKIETENLQNEEATNSEAEASLQSGEINANSDRESSLQSEKNIHSETESLQSGEVTQDKDKSQDVAVEASSEGSSSDDEAVHLETESLKIENDIHPETKNLSYDEAAKASNESNGLDNENVSNEAADNSQNVDDGEIKTAEESAKKPKKKGFFGKLIDGLTKTRDSFVSGLENVFSGFSEIDDDFYEELEEVLIMADIGVATTEKIIENLQAKVKENKIKEVAVCRQLLIDSIKEQMRVHDDAYDFENKKSVVMLIGVNGVGKTTSVGKLASQFKADGKKVILAAADTFRAAAIEQLTEWSNRAGVELIAGQEGGDPAAVVFDAVNAAKARNADILICDTAGRLHNKKNLMEELKKINRIVEREYPDAYRETFVVLDGTTGQNALAQAKQFSQVADITGIILTKLDGTAKGGIAIAIQSEMNIPVKYIGIGEHIEDLQKFDADAFVDALFETKAQ